MEDYLHNVSSPNRYSSFSFSDAHEGVPPRRTHRHHSTSSSGSVQYDRSRKLQSENELLRERLRSCEKGMGKIYQTIVTSRKNTVTPPTFTHKRSASMSYQFESHSLTPSPSPIPEHYHLNGHGTEYDDIFGHPLPQISMPELQSAVEKVLSERENLLSELDDLKQITDAAKRERVLAIDEKDQLLRETHSLRVAVESSQAALSSTEEERDGLQDKLHDLQDELRSLKRDNEKAKEMRSLALEERSKIIAECSELQQELCSFRTERDELYKETLQQRALLDALEDDKKKLEQDLDWMAKKGCGHETTVGRGHKEEKAPPTAKSFDTMELCLKRINSSMPWGFTFEGGRGMEFYHQDPSIVITGVANHTPAASALRFGDRLLCFAGQSLSSVTRKEAADLIRSCDLTDVTLEIGRASANIKPAPEEVNIPGKKDFGFSYETRLFVTSVEEGSLASITLLPGDEILQIQGKSAFNMKPSALKQLLKSCKDGLFLTIQRQPGINLTSFASIPGYRSRQNSSLKLMRDLQETSTCMSLQSSGGARSTQSQRVSNGECTVQSPGTPKSSISESSAGYHSLTHSVPPSENSNTLLHTPNEPDSKTGQHGPERELAFAVPTSSDQRPSVQYQAEGMIPVESDTGHSHVVGPTGVGTGNAISRSSYRNRPCDFYTPRRHTMSTNTGKVGGHGGKPRSYTMNTYKSNPTISNSRTEQHRYLMPRIATPISPGPRPISSTLPANPTKTFSMSADNLDSDPTGDSALPGGVSRPISHMGSHEKTRPQEGVAHMTTPTDYVRGHLSVSMSNMQTHV